MARVLIVEDSPTQATQIQMLLEEAGFEVDLAGHGVEALEKIGRHPPDIVATDLEMPVMNGLRLVEVMRKDFPSVPVILMTAHGSEEIAALALRKGAASYVPKTYLEQDIVPTLERILALTHVDRSHRIALECLTELQSEYVLPNDASIITPIILHLEEVLIRLDICDKTERMRVGVALQEALINGIYHGNLEIGSELRHQDDEKAFFDLVVLRRQQQPYSARRVHLTVKATPIQVIYKVRDEGPGFDPSILPDPTDPANLEKVGGRGLLLIRTFMDTVFHNDRGNEITLVKRHDPSPQFAPPDVVET